MQKPNGYDEAHASGEFTPVNLGGHYAIIKQVAERQSSTGKDMIVVLMDFSSDDSQPNYFGTQYDNDDRDDKKWPFTGTKYIMVQDYNDPKKTSRQFKTFCSCVEKSNKFEIKWGGNNWSQQFKGKKIGVVYGEEESEYDGRITMRRVPKWFCAIDRVKEASIPAPKYLNGMSPATGTTGNASNTSADDFINIPEGTTEEEIPF